MITYISLREKCSEKKKFKVDTKKKLEIDKNNEELIKNIKS